MTCRLKMLCFFFNDTATTEIYTYRHTLSLHDALPIFQGVYDAKADGFSPGGASLHNCMSPHGPDAQTFEKATIADLSKPDYIRNTMAFMFETRRVIRPTDAALSSATLQSGYDDAWAGLQKQIRKSTRLNSSH